MITVVADASALLPAWLPAERYQADADRLIDLHAKGKLEICGPTLLPYEILNGLYLAIRGKAGSSPRLSKEGVEERWRLFWQLQIQIKDIADLGERILELSLTYKRASIYDMAYIALAESLGAVMVTADKRLLNTVGAELPWVQPLWEFKL